MWNSDDFIITDTEAYSTGCAFSKKKNPLRLTVTSDDEDMNGLTWAHFTLNTPRGTVGVTIKSSEDVAELQIPLGFPAILPDSFAETGCDAHMQRLSPRH